LADLERNFRAGLNLDHFDDFGLNGVAEPAPAAQAMQWLEKPGDAKEEELVVLEAGEGIGLRRIENLVESGVGKGFAGKGGPLVDALGNGKVNSRLFLVVDAKGSLDARKLPDDREREISSSLNSFAVRENKLSSSSSGSDRSDRCDCRL
jgi:hypothetical protein